MIEVKDVLREARTLIENGWCQGWSGSVGIPVGDYGELPDKHLRVRHVAPGNEDQRCYCLTGALADVAGGHRELSLIHISEPTRPY